MWADDLDQYEQSPRKTATGASVSAVEVPMLRALKVAWANRLLLSAADRSQSEWQFH